MLFPCRFFFTRGPVIRAEKISGNRVGFCKLDFRRNISNRNSRWILNENPATEKKEGKQAPNEKENEN